MTYAVSVPLPFMAKCSAGCARGRWLQKEPWPVDTVLECTCGTFAEVDDCEHEGCGKPAAFYWRDEIDVSTDTEERYELGDLHRACEEHRPAETRAPR